jgi:hypothetical protein
LVRLAVNAELLECFVDLLRDGEAIFASKAAAMPCAFSRPRTLCISSADSAFHVASLSL